MELGRGSRGISLLPWSKWEDTVSSSGFNPMTFLLSQEPGSLHVEATSTSSLFLWQLARNRLLVFNVGQQDWLSSGSSLAKLAKLEQFLNTVFNYESMNNLLRNLSSGLWALRNIFPKESWSAFSPPHLPLTVGDKDKEEVSPLPWSSLG